MSTGTAPRRIKPFSVRRNVNRKILAFSLGIGAVATLLLAFVYLFSAYPSIRRCKHTILRTLSEISCDGDDVHLVATSVPSWTGEEPEHSAGVLAVLRGTMPTALSHT